MEGVGLFIAFGAGIVSFISPCCLPLIPAYITNLSGVAAHQKNPTASPRFLVMSHAVLFVLGFSAVFIFIWASLGLLGYLVQGYLPYVRMAGGVILVYMGFHVIGLWRIPFMDREMRGGFASPGKPSYPRSLATGAIFAAGWTPCMGPILAAIIGLASLQDSLWRGTYLLVAYSAGLAVPFLATALATEPLMKLFRRSLRHQRAISLVSGLSIIVIGFLMVTNLFATLPRYFNWGTL